MKLTTDLVGVELETVTTEITPRQSMNFAACVGDNNPWYFDDERTEGIVAPPMLVVSLTWPLAVNYTRILQERGYGAALRRQVHYTEYISWERPMIPGETLEIRGEVVGVLPHAAGTHGVVRFHALDTEGKKVFTEVSGAIFRAVRSQGGEPGTTGIPELPARIEAEEPLWAETLHIDPLTAHIYDGCADLHFPIHTSRKFAHKVGLPDPIIHGTCTLSMAVRELVNREAGGDPTRLKSCFCRFTGMVFPDTDITVRLVGASEGDGTRDLFFDVLNADGRKAISEGYLSLR